MMTVALPVSAARIELAVFVTEPSRVNLVFAFPSVAGKATSSLMTPKEFQQIQKMIEWMGVFFFLFKIVHHFSVPFADVALW